MNKKQLELFQSFKILRFPLMGIAVILVMLCHVNFTFMTALSRLPLPIGVDIFFYLSGYGLIISFKEKRPGMWQFYKKRLLRIFPTLWFIVIIFFIITNSLPESIQSKLITKYTFPVLLRQMFGVNYLWNNDFFLWFIDAIVVLYIIFPLYATKFLNSRYKGLITYAGILMALVASAIIGQTNVNPVMQLFIIRIPAFLIGIYVGDNMAETAETVETEKKGIHWLYKNSTITLLLLLGIIATALMVLIAIKYQINQQILIVKYGLIYYPFVIFVHPVILLIFKVFKLMSKVKIFSLIIKAFAFIGSISLQVYIVHMFVLTVVYYAINFAPFAKNITNIMWIAGMLLSILIGYLTYKVISIFESNADKVKKAEVISFQGLNQ